MTNYKLCNNIVNILNWINNVYNKIIHQSKDTINISQYKKKYWLKTIFKYYTDLINFPTQEHELKIELINTISIQSFLLPKIVKNCLSIGHASKNYNFRDSYFENDYANFHSRDRSIVFSGNETNVSIGKIKITFPSKITTNLIEQNGHDEFYNLVIRYSILGPTHGLFLSIDKRIYRILYESSELPVLECYASPFNRNLNNYCSVFSDDKKYGSKGPFSKYINQLNQSCRLIVNPPYTKLVMEECFTVIMNYMKRQRGEFISMLPLMHNYQPMEEFLNFPNTAYEIVKGTEYTIHDYSKDVPIKAKMDLLIVANISMNKYKSSQFVKSIVRCLNYYAL